MRKHTLLLSCMLFFSFLSFAQTNQTNDDFSVGKYKIKIFKNNDNTYGYSIYLDNKLVVNQTSKPFSTVPKGFNNKENIKIIAKWHTNKIDKGEQTMLYMPYEEAIKIGISKDDL